ncbi:peptidase domain-containing ABC transporter [Nocardia sp. NPDC059691]|uniref:peptidase domain-containing ABC transporter n=1 Tax=Nocardia sp. NPDC059691 TaxID=3346908 RepID=UPI0036A0D4E0
MAQNRRADHAGPVLATTKPITVRKMWNDSTQWLGRLAQGGRGRRKVPVCLQTQVADCGAACLAMTLGYHGLAVDFETLRAELAAGRSGTSARALLDTARRFGLGARGVRTDLDGLGQLAPGSILFWNFNHFVVLEAADKNHIDIVDPAAGRRRLDIASVSEAFTGVALEFEASTVPPTAETAAVLASSESRPWRTLARFVPRGADLGKLAAFSLTLMAFQFVLPMATSYLIGAALPGSATGSLWAVLGVGVGLGGLYLGMQLIRSAAVIRVQAALEKHMTWGLVEHLVTLPYEYFTTHNSGDLALRVRSAGLLNQALGVTAVAAVFDCFLVVAYTVAVLVSNTGLALVAVGLVSLQILLLTLTWRHQVVASSEVLERQTMTQDALTDLLESVTTLKAAGVEGSAAERWSHLLVKEINTRSSARRDLSAMSASSRTVQFAAPLIVLLIGMFRVAQGQLSLGAALGFVTLTVALFVPLQAVFDAAAQLAAARPTLARLEEIWRAPSEPMGRRFDAGTSPHSLAATGLSYRYSAASRDALSSIDLSIRAGEFVVVLGRSGSGKSTLGSILAGLSIPTRGTITVNGTDLSTLDRPSYRSRIGYVNQAAHLFNGSIRDNIAFGAHDLPDSDIFRAADIAGVHTEICGMPMGYETLVGPAGHGLSGGQRQRIVLARAVARDPGLLILDEATSALDPELERSILTRLRESGVTVVVIAHRLTVLEQADQVLVLRGGQVVQAGSPAELSRQGGEFASLVDIGAGV